jgi:hypothetical protein
VTDSQLKIAWFDRGVQALNRILTPELGDFYVCPLCREPYGRQQTASHITFEHVPPHSVGGTRIALTCRSCNNSAGTLLDAPLGRDETTRKFLAEGGKAPGTVTVSRDGYEARGELIMEPGTFSFNAVSAQNHPELLDRFRTTGKELHQGAKGGRRIEIRIPVRFNSRRAHLGWLRASYLAAFACLGYRYALQPAFALLLEQFRRPDELLIEPLPLGEDATVNPETRRIALITEPEVMRCLLVRIGRFTAYLPVENDEDFFRQFAERMNVAFRLVGTTEGSRRMLDFEMADYPWPNEPLHLWDV